MRFSCSYLETALILSMLALTTGASAGPCDAWLPGPLWAQSQGINGIVECQTIWTPPTGPTLLVVGGSFTTAGGVAANCIAGWDGASWKALGGGTNFAVWSLTVYNGELIAGGLFTNAGGVPCKCIARFNGSTWQPLGGGLGGLNELVSPACRELAVYNGELYAGGHFLEASGITVRHIARWNGSSWNALAGPAAVGVNGSVPINVTVGAMTVLNNVLYVGGLFQTAASIPASNVAKWDGSAWTTLGGSGRGVNNEVQALHQINGELTLVGDFLQAITQSGNITANGVARWNPTTQAWGTFGSGISGTSVRAVMNFNGGMLAGGWSHSGGPNVAFWNGSTWSLFGGGVSGPSTPHQPQVTSLSFFNGRVTIGGFFNTAGIQPANNMAEWTGTAWNPVHKPDPRVFALETVNSRIIAGGRFTHSTTNFAPTSALMGWNGTTLTSVGGGISGGSPLVSALKSYTSGGIARLIVAGDFTFVGDPFSDGISASRIAQFNEPALFGTTWTALGAGFNALPLAVERFNNVTYAGGPFTMSGATPLNAIAQFNGTNWVSLGTGMNGFVWALKAYNGFLYAGGDFTTAGGVSTGGLARWNGSTWSNVALPFIGTVYAIEVHNNELVIGGEFTVSGSGAPNICKWNGSNFSHLGPGSAGANDTVNELRTDGQSIYVGGDFSSAGGISISHLAKWNATDGWTNVAGGVGLDVEAIGFYHGELHVAGIGASPAPSHAWARYTADGVPWVAANPSGQTINCEATATFTAQVAAGYPDVTASWRRNGLPLNNGPTGHGSTISGSQSTTLIITSARSADAGSYSCLFTNPCGSITSNAATLTVNDCCDGDIVGNGGEVNFDDLVAVITSWGPCPAPPANCPADVNGSGTVNIDDLVVVITGWGACP